MKFARPNVPTHSATERRKSDAPGRAPCFSKMYFSCRDIPRQGANFMANTQLQVTIQTRKCVVGAMFATLSALASATAPAGESLNVFTEHNAYQELALKARVEAVAEKYHLDKWLYTRTIRIDKDAWPSHSHPVLTLGVREQLFRDDAYLVGMILHEEFHWNMVLHSNSMPEENAARVKEKFPGLDTAPPKGAGGEVSTYGHVLVCYMEYKALAKVFGEDAALKSIQALPFYTDIYALVTDKKNEATLEDLLRQEGVSI